MTPALSDPDMRTRVREIPNVNSSMAISCANESRMLPIRDLTALKEMGLLHEGRAVYRQKKLIEAFLPFRIERKEKREPAT